MPNQPLPYATALNVSPRSGTSTRRHVPPSPKTRMVESAPTATICRLPQAIAFRWLLVGDRRTFQYAPDRLKTMKIPQRTRGKTHAFMTSGTDRTFRWLSNWGVSLGLPNCVDGPGGPVTMARR